MRSFFLFSLLESKKIVILNNRLKFFPLLSSKATNAVLANAVLV